MSKPSEIIRRRAIDRLNGFTLKVSILEQEILNFLDETAKEKECNIREIKKECIFCNCESCVCGG